MSMLKRSFTLAPGGEYSIEVDPRTVNAERLALLAELGFNRLSFGVKTSTLKSKGSPPCSARRASFCFGRICTHHRV
jgi:hypothetical protein